ncbi:cytochrome P450 [Pholiota molesta]|nr:cytochrome P450 [Pholiota molesta]
MSALTTVLNNIPLSIWLSAPLLAFGLFLSVRGGLRWQTLKNLRGPSSSSWLYGHQVEFYRQNDVGELDFNWANEYGGAWKIDGCFGRNILMLSDPNAIRHTIHTMGYGYPKTRESKTFTGLAFGRGVSWAGGETHVRHRKLLNPAFTAQAQRPFYPVFRRVAAQLTSQWKDKLQEGDCSDFQVMDISRGLVNTTLDIIGEAVFDYHFGSLDGKEDKNEFSEVFHNLFADSNLFPPKAAILFAASWAYWPEVILRYVGNLPFRQFIRFKDFLTHGKQLGKDLIENQAAAVDGKKRRDILSILVEANKTNSNADRLSEDEVLSQVTTLLFAGHETTATTLTWIMYELAKHPEDQARVREEVQTKRLKITANGQRDFTATDLESMTFTNAVIKEGLRMHPISPWITREAAVHDVIPLSEPVIGIDGKSMSEIKVVPGQPVLVSTCAYNRHCGAWGEDSHQWSPNRHLNQDMKDKQTPVGLYSNLLTFAGGPSGCMGWRFALTEMQSTVVEMVENFEFCAPADNVKMLRTPVGAIMAPMVEGKFEERTQMPLGVRPL